MPNIPSELVRTHAMVLVLAGVHGDSAWPLELRLLAGMMTGCCFIWPI
jgi:hypothetical protein